MWPLISVWESLGKTGSNSNAEIRNSNNRESLPLTVCISLRSEEHTSELQSRLHLVCRLLLEKKNANFRLDLARNLRALWSLRYSYEQRDSSIANGFGNALSFKGVTSFVNTPSGKTVSSGLTT